MRAQDDCGGWRQGHQESFLNAYVVHRHSKHRQPALTMVTPQIHGLDYSCPAPVNWISFR